MFCYWKKPNTAFSFKQSHVTMFVPESLYNISSMRSLLTARELQLHAAEGNKMASPMAYSAAEQKIQLYSPVRLSLYVYMCI